MTHSSTESFTAVTDMEAPLKTATELNNAIKLISVGIDGDSTNAITELTWLIRDKLKALEELRCKLFDLTNPWSHARAERADALSITIQSYRAAVAKHAAIPRNEITRDNEDALIDATYGPIGRTLGDWSQPATTLEGAIEALRFMKEQNVFIDEFGEPMRRAVLGYLEGMRT